MSVDDKAINKTANGKTYSDSKDWNAGFEYIPTSVGQKTITFTSGELSEQVVLMVE